MIDKQIILMPVSVHVIKAKIMELIMSGKVDINTLSLRELGNLIGVEESPQKVKHHLEQLVSMGTLEKRKGNYFFDYEEYKNLINNLK